MSDAGLEQAREQLSEVRTALSELWEHLYAPEWQPEMGRSGFSHKSKPPIPDDAFLPVKRTYNEVLDELSRAHWVLGRGTDVPAHWTRHPDPTERSRIVPHSEARMWAEVLDGMLAWCADNGQTGQAVSEACGHITSAHGRIEDLWPPQGQPKPKVCANPNGCPNPPRKQGSQCEACVTYRSRHGKDRVVREDGRAA